MPRYSIYGLSLQANCVLPGLPALAEGGESAASAADIEVVMGGLPDWFRPGPEGQAEGDEADWYVSQLLDTQGQPGFRISKLDQGRYFWLRYSSGLEFVLDCAGSRLWATWPPDWTISDVTPYVLGPVAGFILRLRGLVCLHASAVAVGGRVLVFLGQSGAGKSTTAAAFADLGYRVLSDDIVALAGQQNELWVQPAYPFLRLLPEALDALNQGRPATDRHRLPLSQAPASDKFHLNLGQTAAFSFQSEALPLAGVYLLDTRLDDEAAPLLKPTSARDALITLTTHTYGNRLLDKTMRSYEFKLLSNLVKHYPVRRLVSHSDPARLFQLCRLVLADFALISGHEY